MTDKIRNVLIECLEEADDGENKKRKMAMGIINKAISGDVRAFITVAKFIGEFPTKRQIVETDAEIKSKPFGL